MNSVQTTSKAFELIKGAGIIQDLKDRFMPPDRPTFKEDLTLQGHPGAGTLAGVIGGGALGYKGVSRPVANAMHAADMLRENTFNDVINRIGISGGRGDDLGSSFLESLRGRSADFLRNNMREPIMEVLERTGKIPRVGPGRLLALLAVLGAPIAGVAAGGAAGSAAGTSIRNNMYGTNRINKLQNKRDAFEAYGERVGSDVVNQR